MFEVPLFIGGRSRAAGGNATFDRINPVSGEVASRAAAAGVEDARAAVEAAKAAFPAWSATAPNARRALLLKAADLMDARAPDFIARGVAEAGGAPMWYGFNVMLAAGMLREAASLTTQISGEVIPSDVPGSLAMAIRQPAGVVVGIAPWNAPVILGTRAIATPLACGNTVVLKSSEACPALHALIGEVLTEAGLPAGVVNVVSNAPQDAPAVVEALIAHPAVRRVNFTGSTRVGRRIGELAAQHLKPAVLELGGRNPLIVLDDADLDAAVDAALFSAFFNQGQICMSADRVIVHQAVAEDFLARFAKRTAALKADAPGAEGAALAAMVDPQAAARVRAMVDDALAKGAHLVAGSAAVAGAVMQPAIVDGVTAGMRLANEESFGPVVTIQRVASDDEAVSQANASEYGLSAAVFSRDVGRAMDVARRIESGICHINGPTVHDEAQMPFGGVKDSGYGRFGGKAGIEAFTELRWITIQHGPRHYPI